MILASLPSSVKVITQHDHLNIFKHTKLHGLCRSFLTRERENRSSLFAAAMREYTLCDTFKAVSNNHVYDASLFLTQAAHGAISLCIFYREYKLHVLQTLCQLNRSSNESKDSFDFYI